MLRIEALTPEGVTISDGDLPARNREGRPGSFYSLRFEKEAATWRNVGALSWGPAGSEPPAVHIERQGDKWLVRAGARGAALHWQK